MHSSRINSSIQLLTKFSCFRNFPGGNVSSEGSLFHSSPHLKKLLDYLAAKFQELRLFYLYSNLVSCKYIKENYSQPNRLDRILSKNTLAISTDVELRMVLLYSHIMYSKPKWELVSHWVTSMVSLKHNFLPFYWPNTHLTTFYFQLFGGKWGVCMTCAEMHAIPHSHIYGRYVTHASSENLILTM